MPGFSGPALPPAPTDPRILLLEGVHEAGERVLAQAGYTNIERHDSALAAMRFVIACAGSTYWASGRVRNWTPKRSPQRIG